MEEYYIGLDIGGTKCAAALGKKIGEKIQIEEKKQFPTGTLSPEAVLEKFSEFIKKQRKEIRGIGVSCGGPLNSAKGIVMKPPSLPLWNGTEVTAYFEKKFGVKTYLQNDANACAVAEWKFGAGKGAKNMAFLTFGTGFGAGLILNGRLYSGTNDNAGEIGHVRLTKKGPEGYFKEGSCEGYCSGGGIARLAKIMSRNKRYQKSYGEFSIASKGEVTAKTIAAHARLGNAFCKAVYKKSGEMLGRTLSILTDILNLEKIVIGGVYMRAEDLLYPPCIAVMKKETLQYSLSCVKILPAGLGENVGDYAALSVAQGDF